MGRGAPTRTRWRRSTAATAAALERAGVVDAGAVRLARARRAASEPDAWGATPLFVYGFDDFTPLELDALETIAARCGADVKVSLPFEPGRDAFRATARIRQELLACGADELALEPVDDHYAEGSRGALHQLERRLFEAARRAGRSRRRDLLPQRRRRARRGRARGGARCSSCCARASEPGDVAVVFREPSALRVAARAGLRRLRDPVLDRPPRPVRPHGLGRGLLALIRCASLGGSADDLLAYLRTPGACACRAGGPARGRGTP